MTFLKRAMNARTDELLRAIRLERRRSIADHMLLAGQWLFIGALIGGAIALFATPSTGEELRSQVGSKLQGARDKARDAASKIRRRTNARESARA
jgi:gas vesicle protein